MKNKVFNLIIQELKKGKIVSSDTLNISNKVDQVPMEVNGDTMIYVLPMPEKAGFSQSRDSMLITIAGVFKNDILKLNIQYPGIIFSKKLRGKKIIFCEKPSDVLMIKLKFQSTRNIPFWFIPLHFNLRFPSNLTVCLWRKM